MTSKEMRHLAKVIRLLQKHLNHLPPLMDANKLGLILAHPPAGDDVGPVEVLAFFNEGLPALDRSRAGLLIAHLWNNIEPIVAALEGLSDLLDLDDRLRADHPDYERTLARLRAQRDL